MGFFGAVGNWIDVNIIQKVKDFGHRLVGLLKSFWTSFHEKIKSIIDKFRAKFNKTVLGVLTLLRKGVDGMITKVSRNITNVNGMFEQLDVVSKPIPPNEVPVEFLNKIMPGNEIDVSNDYAMLLNA